MTRSIRYDRQLPPERPPVEAEEGRKGLTLFGVFIMCGALLGTSALAWSWITSDYSGEYIAQDPKLGSIRMELARSAASLSGSLSLSAGETLDIVEGHVNAKNDIEISFAPPSKSDSDERDITATFKGELDPARFEQGSSTISFNQVLRPYAGEGSEAPQAQVTVPRMGMSEKTIKGTLTYNGRPFELSLKRNALTTMFHQLKSFWPGH